MNMYIGKVHRDDSESHFNSSLMERFFYKKTYIIKKKKKLLARLSIVGIHSFGVTFLGEGDIKGTDLNVLIISQDLFVD